MKRILKYAFSIILLGLIGLAVFSYIQAKNAPLKVKVVNPVVKDIETTIFANGKIQPKTTYELNFTSPGKISYLPFKEGNSVEKNTVLAALDSSDLTQQITKSQRDYQVTYEKVKEYEYTNRDKVKDEKYILPLNQLIAQRESAASVIAQYLTTRYNRTIVSPIDGIITQKSGDLGEISSINIPVITVSDLTTLEFVAEVDEQDAGKLSEGQTASIMLDAMTDQEKAGSIVEISKVSKLNSSGGTYYATKIQLNENSPYIRSGMNGDATIQLEKKSNILTIPNEAISEDNNQSYVWTVANNQAKKTFIKLGIQNDSLAEVLEGITSNNIVIISELDKVKENVKVTTEK
ncbi:MAG: efflux RND transporter periplasmic adaptor subunit [bacterium]|nr:efflux RND transporter periplasmic adaptor subunit [bacterium]